MNPFGTMLNICTVAASTATNTPSITGRCRSTSAEAPARSRASSASNAAVHQPGEAASCCATTRRNRLHSIGVSVTDTTPEIRIAVGDRDRELAEQPAEDAAHEQDRNEHRRQRRRHRQDREADLLRALAAPPRAALSPCSMCRTMFSSITIASSTTKPIERISAIIDRLLRLKFSTCITAKVPRIENGSASAGISVAEPLCRKRIDDADHQHQRDQHRRLDVA